MGRRLPRHRRDIRDFSLLRVVSHVQPHKGLTSAVKQREMMSVGNAAVSGSMNASSYSSENLEAPSSFNSSARNSFEMRGHIEAGTFTRCQLPSPIHAS